MEEFKQSVSHIQDWEWMKRQRFYDSFKQILDENIHYEELGVKQRDKGSFAEDPDQSENEELARQLKALSASAVREASAVQNLTVYCDVRSIWQNTGSALSLLKELEEYAEERSEWNERNELENDYSLQARQKISYGQEEYIYEILEELVTEAVEDIEK